MYNLYLNLLIYKRGNEKMAIFKNVNQAYFKQCKHCSLLT